MVRLQSNAGYSPQMRRPASTLRQALGGGTQAVRRLPQTQVLLAVFPRDASPARPLRRINKCVSVPVAADMARYAVSRSVRFLDLNAALLNADGTLSRELMPDGLHPGGKGYETRQRAMDARLQQLFAAGTAVPRKE